MTLPRALACCTVLLLALSSGAVVYAAVEHPGHPTRSAAVTAGAILAPPALAPTTTRPAGKGHRRSRPAARTAGHSGTGGRADSTVFQSDSAVAGPTSAADPPASAPRQVVLPTPRASTLPPLPPLSATRSADAEVLVSAPISYPQDLAVRQLKGVAYVEPVATGTVKMARASVVAWGVDPVTFRPFTPPASATSTRLWQYLAAGSLVSSYEMATDRQLQLGSEQTISSAAGPSGEAQGWMGAFASIGLPGVDLLVDQAYAGDLGLVPDTGLVISAPTVPGPQLLDELHSALPGAAVELLRSNQLGGLPAGDGLTSVQRSAVIAAALSKVGSPYVWGGAGPSVFDCSGLVQWSFAQAGISMPRTAAEQYLTGIRIPLADASPGDLLFWTYDPNDPRFVDHTAIYLGDGLMVVAPHTGLDVQVTSVPTADFAGAIQVLLRSG